MTSHQSKPVPGRSAFDIPFGSKPLKQTPDQIRKERDLLRLSQAGLLREIARLKKLAKRRLEIINEYKRGDR